MSRLAIPLALLLTSSGCYSLRSFCLCGGIPHPTSVRECERDHPDWAQNVCEAIVRRDVVVGMNEEQVRASWGEPKHTDIKVTSDGSFNELRFANGRTATLHNGLVTAVQ